MKYQEKIVRKYVDIVGEINAYDGDDEQAKITMQKAAVAIEELLTIATLFHGKLKEEVRREIAEKLGGEMGLADYTEKNAVDKLLCSFGGLALLEDMERSGILPQDDGVTYDIRKNEETGQIYVDSDCVPERLVFDKEFGWLYYNHTDGPKY